MKKLIVLLLISLIGCAPSVIVQEQPLKYSFMPKYLDIDSIGVELPPTPDTLVHEDAVDFKSKPILGGTYISEFGDTAQLPPGVLVSERNSVRYVFYEAGYRRQAVELDYLKSMGRDYYDKSLEAEKLYQNEIKRLRELSKRSWLEKNMGYIGFAAGLITMILTDVAVIKIFD